MNFFSRGLRALAVGALFAVAASGATPALAADTTTTITFEGLGPRLAPVGTELIRDGYKFTTTSTSGLFTDAFNFSGSDPFDTRTLLASTVITMTKVGGGLFTYLSSKLAPGVVNSIYSFKVFADNPGVDKDGIGLDHTATNEPLTLGSGTKPREVVATAGGWATDSVTWSTTTYNNSGVQLGEVVVAPFTPPVPGPVAGAGLPMLLAAIGGFVAYRRRKIAVAV